MDHLSLPQLEPHGKLLKVKLTKEIEDNATRILGGYLIDVNGIPEITDKVYAIGKTIAFKLGMKQPEQIRTSKRNTNAENRRERTSDKKAATLDSKNMQ